MVCRELSEDLSDISRMEVLKGIKNSAILVTGGTGFIAYYITLALLSNNDISHADNMVVLMVRNMERALEKYRELAGRGDLRFLIQDVREELLCGNMPVDYIIHTAMAAEPSRLEGDPVGVFETAVSGTKQILDFALSKRVKSVVYLSSVTVYGDAEAADIIEEGYVGNEDWKNDRSCYTYGKRCAEFLCLVSYRKKGLPVKIIRPGYVYGAGNLNDTRVYSEIIRNAATGIPIILKSAGLLNRPLVYVTNLVRAILCVMANGRDGTGYNVADGTYSIRQFAEMAVRVSGDENVCLKYANESDMSAESRDVKKSSIDCHKINEECGYLPVIGIEKGIKDALKIFSYCREKQSDTKANGKPGH